MAPENQNPKSAASRRAGPSNPADPESASPEICAIVDRRLKIMDKFEIHIGKLQKMLASLPSETTEKQLDALKDFTSRFPHDMQNFIKNCIGSDQSRLKNANKADMKLLEEPTSRFIIINSIATNMYQDACEKQKELQNEMTKTLESALDKALETAKLNLQKSVNVKDDPKPAGACDGG